MLLLRQLLFGVLLVDRRLYLETIERSRCLYHWDLFLLRFF